MPVLGGMTVLQELRDRYPDIPVIVMSHSILIHRLRQAVKLGAREYLETLRFTIISNQVPSHVVNGRDAA